MFPLILRFFIAPAMLDSFGMATHFGLVVYLPQQLHKNYTLHYNSRLLSTCLL
jgi:hypothetical protein